MGQVLKVLMHLFSSGVSYEIVSRVFLKHALLLSEGMHKLSKVNQKSRVPSSPGRPWPRATGATALGPVAGGLKFPKNLYN